jgi:hypothetical protein
VEELEEFAQLGVCNFQLPRQKFFLCIFTRRCGKCVTGIGLCFVLFSFVFFSFFLSHLSAMKIILVLSLHPKALAEMSSDLLTIRI